MTGSRRLSQAIAEGDGISLIAPAADPESAKAAETQGAEGIVVERGVAGVRGATGLPILWRVEASAVHHRPRAGDDVPLVRVQQRPGQAVADPDEANRTGERE